MSPFRAASLVEPLEARREMAQRRRLPEHLQPGDPRAPAIEILEDLALVQPPGGCTRGVLSTRKPLAQSDSPTLY